MILDMCPCCAQRCNYRGEKQEDAVRSTRGNYLKEYVSKLLEKTCESIGADAASVSRRACIRACMRACVRACVRARRARIAEEEDRDGK